MPQTTASFSRPTSHGRSSSTEAPTKRRRIPFQEAAQFGAGLPALEDGSFRFTRSSLKVGTSNGSLFVPKDEDKAKRTQILFPKFSQASKLKAYFLSSLEDIAKAMDNKKKKAAEIAASDSTSLVMPPILDAFLNATKGAASVNATIAWADATGPPYKQILGKAHVSPGPLRPMPQTTASFSRRPSHERSFSTEAPKKRRRVTFKEATRCGVSLPALEDGTSYRFTRSSPKVGTPNSSLFVLEAVDKAKLKQIPFQKLSQVSTLRAYSRSSREDIGKAMDNKKTEAEENAASGSQLLVMPSILDAFLNATKGTAAVNATIAWVDATGPTYKRILGEASVSPAIAPIAPAGPTAAPACAPSLFQQCSLVCNMDKGNLQSEVVWLKMKLAIAEEAQAKLQGELEVERKTSNSMAELCLTMIVEATPWS